MLRMTSHRPVSHESRRPWKPKAVAFNMGIEKQTVVPTFKDLNLIGMLQHDPPSLAPSMAAGNGALRRKETSIQYECAALPAQQLAVTMPQEPFSRQQQRQTRCDGHLEVDQTTRRPLLNVVPESPLRCIAAERASAHLNNRMAANPHQDLSLTGCE